MNGLLVIDQNINITFGDEFGLRTQDNEYQCNNDKGEEKYTQDDFKHCLLP
jgi:hypothetical protein